MDLAILFFRFGPYHIARLRATGEILPLTAIECSGQAIEYNWDLISEAPTFDRVTLFPDRNHREVSLVKLRTKLDQVLSEIAPDVIAIPGWADRGALAALHWSYVNGIPTVVMSASTAHDHERKWWREAVKGRVVRSFGAGLVGGRRHVKYLQRLGMPKERVFAGYDVVENGHFTRGAKAARRNTESLRRQYNLPGCFFLSTCRFIPKKNLPRLIEAFSEYRTRYPDRGWDLVVLGDGPERSTVKNAIVEAGVEDAVHLPGFKQYEDLPAYYGLADAFVHASTREQWGLVVNEAMATGLPVIVSDRCGCAPDLVEDGRNGFTFDPYDPSVLAGLMGQVAHGDVDREQMGAASRTIIADWGPERFAMGLRKAAEAAVDAGPPSTSLLDRLLMKGLMYR